MVVPALTPVYRYLHNRRVRGITVQALGEKTYNRYVPVLNKRAKKKSKNCKQKGGDKNRKIYKRYRYRIKYIFSSEYIL